MISENDVWFVFWAFWGNYFVYFLEMNNLFVGKYKGEDYYIICMDEMIGFFIIEVGFYQVCNWILEVGLGSDIVCGFNNNGYIYDFDNFEIWGVVLSVVGMDGGNGYWLVFFGEQFIEFGLI